MHVFGKNRGSAWCDGKVYIGMVTTECDPLDVEAVRKVIEDCEFDQYVLSELMSALLLSME